MGRKGHNAVDSDEELLQTIESIYDCAIDPTGFDRLPSRLVPVLNAKSATIWCVDTDLQPAVAGNSGLPQAGVDEYVGGWLYEDPLIPTALQSHVGRAVTADEMLGKRNFRSLPVFEGFYEYYDIVRPVGRFDHVSSRWLAGIVCQRGRSDPPIGDEDRYRINVLARHLRRAWLIALRMGTLSLRARSAEALLSSCRLATWLLDGQRHVHASNEAADGLTCRDGSGVLVAHGALRFADAETDAAFGEALRRLEAGQRTPADLPLRDDGRQAFVWGTAIPVEHNMHGADRIQTLYLLVLARRGSDADISWRQLEQRLPISRTEADVLARLMRAEDPPAIADARGSTLETIRGYEKSLRTKLDCHSRAELVAEGWRTVAAIPTLGAAYP